jgi:hypothetical protein
LNTLPLQLFHPAFYYYQASFPILLAHLSHYYWLTRLQLLTSFSFELLDILTTSI